MKKVAAKTVKLLLLVVACLLVPHVGLADEISGVVRVFAMNSSSPTSAAPPFATATLNDEESQEYGNGDLVTFIGSYEPGLHTVEVTTTVNGYVPRPSPSDANAVNDPFSEYGNPRYVTISESNRFPIAGFQFDPVIQATAIVRDAWTMERIDGAAIEFVFEGTSGPITITKYPSPSTYASNWTSDAEGIFPSNTIMYLEDYDVQIIKSGYELFTWNNVITNASPGDYLDLGTLFLQPIDADGNQVADAWETLHFGPGSNVDANVDTDQDGMSNRDEYIAGTDPTDWNSCLWSDFIIESNILYLVWDTEPGRSYRVCGTTNLLSDTWVQVGGTWETANGQTNMFWAETNHHMSWNNRYRVEVVPCWWEGTNQILIRTNDWPTSGTLTNGPGGPPPIP